MVGAVVGITEVPHERGIKGWVDAAALTKTHAAYSERRHCYTQDLTLGDKVGERVLG